MLSETRERSLSALMCLIGLLLLLLPLLLSIHRCVIRRENSIGRHEPARQPSAPSSSPALSVPSRD